MCVLNLLLNLGSTHFLKLHTFDSILKKIWIFDSDTQVCHSFKIKPIVSSIHLIIDLSFWVLIFFTTIMFYDYYIVDSLHLHILSSIILCSAFPFPLVLHFHPFRFLISPFQQFLNQTFPWFHLYALFLLIAHEPWSENRSLCVLCHR